MSTKAIRMTLEWVKEQLEDSLDRPFSRDQTKLDEMRLAGLKKALAEVEAIEGMAMNIVEKGGREALWRANYGPAVEMLERIAKEAP